MPKRDPAPAPKSKLGQKTLEEYYARAPSASGVTKARAARAKREIRVPVYDTTTTGILLKYHDDGYLVYEKETDAVEECAVCLEGEDDGGEERGGLALECGHVYHRDCLLAWLSKPPKGPENRGCPICRAKVVKTFCACGCTSELH